MMKDVMCIDDSDEIEKIMGKYQNLCDMKETYVENLQLAINDKELSKEESFKMSTLNIKLSKFLKARQSQLK